MAAEALKKNPEKVFSCDWASMSAADQRKFFSENGFIVVPQAFSPDEVATILREIDEYALESKPRDMMEAFCTAPSMSAMVDNRKLLQAVRAAIGDDIVCFKGAYVTKKSKPVGETPHSTALHMDYGIGEWSSDYRNSTALWVNCACYLTEMTFEHAPFAVVPGSNRHYHLVPGTDLEALRDDAVTILAKPGDALVFLHNTVHAGGANVSGTTQHILFTSYRPRWARPIGRVVEWPKSFVETSPETRRKLVSDLNRGVFQPELSVLQRIREAIVARG